MAQLKDSLITGDLRVTGTIYGTAEELINVIKPLYAIESQTTGVYNVKLNPTDANPLSNTELITFLEEVYADNQIVILICDDMIAQMSIHSATASVSGGNIDTYVYGFMGIDDGNGSSIHGKIYHFITSSITSNVSDAVFTKYPAYSAVDFTQGINGILDLAHGGTNKDNSSATAGQFLRAVSDGGIMKAQFDTITLQRQDITTGYQLTGSATGVSAEVTNTGILKFTPSSFGLTAGNSVSVVTGYTGDAGGNTGPTGTTLGARDVNEVSY